MRVTHDLSELQGDDPSVLLLARDLSAFHGLGKCGPGMGQSQARRQQRHSDPLGTALKNKSCVGR
jgi:hypothetical protein